MYLEKPKVTKVKADEIVEEGMPLKLEVKVTGSPQPSVSWQHQGVPLASDVFVRTEHGISRLFVRNVFLRHSGTYTAIAENEDGSDQLEFAVSVVGEQLQLTLFRASFKAGNKTYL